MRHKSIFLALALAMLIGSVLMLGTPTQRAYASAQKTYISSCRNLGVYTDWYNNKPSIYIWNGAVRPVPSKMSISFYGPFGWEPVPSPSDWGVRTDAPQVENRNGWYIYFIATRWIYLTTPHSLFWNDDWRWRVTYCS